jgi:hypothetical protein
MSPENISPRTRNLTISLVIVENTTASGHLYEIPHVTKMAECVTAVLQEKGKGATWVFEDAYAKNTHWSKFSYTQVSQIRKTLSKAVSWAEKYVSDFSLHQKKTLPWLKTKS